MTRRLRAVVLLPLALMADLCAAVVARIDERYASALGGEDE